MLKVWELLQLVVRPDCELVTSSSLPSARLDFTATFSGLNEILPCGWEYVTPVEVTKRLLLAIADDKGEATVVLFLNRYWADEDASGDFFRPC